jgi:magnesium chelatase family protein
MVVAVQAPDRDQLMSEGRAEGSAAVRERVMAARERQAGRLAGSGVHSNAEMNLSLVQRHCRLTGGAREALRVAHDRVGLSGRGHHRVLRVARTLADMDGRDRIERAHVAQAVAYRELRPLEAAAAA